ncbi:MAG TPA: glucose 1-dehydrogenase [Anaerolineales bacterium]|nr:glucose 1-dehydrogenase [Anaerolineales bacterium]
MKNKQPSFHLDGQVALVTASAKGIGKACALALARAGANIILGLRDKESVQALALVRQIRKLGREVLPVQMDVAQMDQIRDAVDEGVRHFKHIDILVNNAGIGAPNPAEKVLEKDFDETLAVNLKGTFFTAQTVGKVMIRQRRGRIINISSQAGFVALPTESVYCMTKAAIAHLTKCLALEWAKYNITVNAVAPTFIETPGTKKWLGNREFRKSVQKRIPLGRIGTPEDVAEPVVFLASPAASLITGETLMIDGGWTIQ